MCPWLRVDVLKRGQSPWGDAGMKWFLRGDRVVQWVNEDQNPSLQSAVISQCQLGYEGLLGYAFHTENQDIYSCEHIHIT